MAVSIVAGVASDNTILSNQRIIDMSEKISLLEPDVAPLTTFLAKQASKDAFSQKVEWLQDALVPRTTGLAATAATGDTTISVTVGTGAYFRSGDVLRICSTGENVAVTAQSTDTLGVTRAIGSVTGLSAAIGVDVVLIGNASAEGATIGTLKQTKLTNQYNYTQIQRNPYGATNTLVNSNLYGGPDIPRERKKKLLEHKIALEHTLWFGRRALNTGGAQPIGYCGGMIDYIATNITTAASGALTLSTFETFLRTGARYSTASSNYCLFVTPLVASGLSSYPMGRLAPPSPTVNEWGVKATQWQSGAFGGWIDIVVMREWMDWQVATPQLGGYAFLVDLDDIRMRPLQNRNTKLYDNRQAPDEDSIKEEYITEYSFEVGQEARHSVLRGVTAYS